MTDNIGPIIHGGVVLHGISLVSPSQITYLVTNQAIIPAVLPQPNPPQENNSQKTP